MSVMKIHYKKLGGHYHCAVFTARVPNTAYAKNGDLVFDEREWSDIKLIISGAQFIDTEEPVHASGFCMECDQAFRPGDNYFRCADHEGIKP